jgi:hypothetical protein
MGVIRWAGTNLDTTKVLTISFFLTLLLNISCSPLLCGVAVAQRPRILLSELSAGCVLIFGACLPSFVASLL